MLELEPLSPVAGEPQRAAVQHPPAATAVVRVVVADDHPLYREGIVRALDAFGGFLVVGEAGDGVTALNLLRELTPDVALLDVRMPLLDGVDVVHALALHGPDVPVVLLSAFTDRQLVDSGLHAGAAAYIDKTSDREAICARVAEVVERGADSGPRTLSPRDGFGRRDAWTPRLTGREHEILQLSAKGMSKIDIAHLLGREEADVRRDAGEVMRKLDTDSLQDAVADARALGLVR